MGQFTHVFALQPAGQQILRFDVADGSARVLVTGVAAVPDGVVVDPGRARVYWTNMGVPSLVDEGAPPAEHNLDYSAKNGSLESVGTDGSGRAFLLPEGSFVTGKQLAAAWSAGRLYWSDREGAAVRSVLLDGTGHRCEVSVATMDADRRVLRNQCVGVAVDERNGFLYWTQKGPSKGGDGRIFRTSLEIPAGQGPADRDFEVLWSGLPEPIDLELDLEAGAIYWTDRGAEPNGNTLNRAAIPPQGEPGGEITILSSGFHEAIGLAVDKAAALAYVGDLSGEIRAVKLDGSGERVFAKIDGSFTGLAGI